MGWRARLILVPLFAVACGPGGSSSSGRDGAAADTQITVSLPDLPPGCPPSAGNDIGVGKPCTATGTECTGSLQCSCKNWFGYTMPAGMPCFCTNVTTGTKCLSCGSSATCCTYDIPLTIPVTVSACFPAVCAPGGQCPAIQ